MVPGSANTSARSARYIDTNIRMVLMIQMDTNFHIRIIRIIRMNSYISIATVSEANDRHELTRGKITAVIILYKFI